MFGNPRGFFFLRKQLAKTNNSAADRSAKGETGMTQRRKLEDYMRTIYSLRQKGAVRGADIAESLRVSRPTVSVSLREMEEEGYLIRRKDKTVELTERGLEIAREIAGRNNSLYQLLVDLGVSRATARKDACDMEHAISRESFLALMALAAAQTE